MRTSTRVVQEDFDRIALLSEGGADNSSPYYNLLLKQLPPCCAYALEIGCGTGSFTRLLARRSDWVLALDLSPQMIRVAKERSRQCSNIEYQIADVLEMEFPREQFDCIASIATLHHMPVEKILPKMQDALKPGGTLILLDLFQTNGLADVVTGALALPVSDALRLVKTGRLCVDRRVREAWAEHGRHDTYLTLSQARRLYAEYLPGARVRKHLLWRYSVVWKKL